MLEYGLLDTKYQHPDIIVNAYSTNDHHIIAVKESELLGLSLEENIFATLQEFYRTALSLNDDDGSCVRSPPLVIHFNDYIGNEQREIMDTMSIARVVSMLSSYYGTASASYVDVVRDWVYGDTREGMFSPPAWYDVRFVGMQREIHPGEPMVSAIVCFNIYLIIGRQFCHGVPLSNKLQLPLYFCVACDISMDSGLPTIGVHYHGLQLGNVVFIGSNKRTD
jgi:hypothetical protein